MGKRVYAKDVVLISSWLRTAERRAEGQAVGTWQELRRWPRVFLTGPDVPEPGTALHSCRDVPHGPPGDPPWVPSGRRAGRQAKGCSLCRDIKPSSCQAPRLSTITWEL